VTIPNDFDPKEIFPDYAGVVNAEDDEDDGEEAGSKSAAVKSATVHLPETDVRHIWCNFSCLRQVCS